MKQDANSMLLAFAKDRRARVRAIESYDPNVCQFTVDAAQQWKLRATEGHPFSHEARFSHQGRRVTIESNKEWLRLEVRGDLDVGVCSINKSDAVTFMDKVNTTIAKELRWDVFLPAGMQPTDELQTFLNSAMVRKAVDRLIGIDPASTSLHIFCGAVVLYMLPHSSQGIDDKVETLASLVGVYRPRLSRSALMSLPKRFHDLIPLIMRWSEPDDSKRSALLDDVTSVTLSELVAAVAPETREINAYLNSFADKPWSEAASALATLAECAAEARLRLSRT